MGDMEAVVAKDDETVEFLFTDSPSVVTSASSAVVTTEADVLRMVLGVG